LLDPTEYPLAELVQLYGRRWQVELNLRYVKVQMETAQWEAHSAEMARKEWLAGLIAYNLIRAAMLCAALHTQTQPLSLSFSACRRRLEYWLRDFGFTKRRAVANWKQTLTQLGQCRLPKRRSARPNEPRAQLHLWQSFPPLRGSRAAARTKLQNAKLKSKWHWASCLPLHQGADGLGNVKWEVLYERHVEMRRSSPVKSFEIGEIDRYGKLKLI
jgi:hypothetical protein